MILVADGFFRNYHQRNQFQRSVLRSESRLDRIEKALEILVAESTKLTEKQGITETKIQQLIGYNQNRDLLLEEILGQFVRSKIPSILSITVTNNITETYRSVNTMNYQNVDIRFEFDAIFIGHYNDNSNPVVVVVETKSNPQVRDITNFIYRLQNIPPFLDFIRNYKRDIDSLIPTGDKDMRLKYLIKEWSAAQDCKTIIPIFAFPSAPSKQMITNASENGVLLLARNGKEYDLINFDPPA
jgi:hypothetical protein